MATIFPSTYFTPWFAHSTPLFCYNRPQNILRKHKKQLKLSRPASTNSKWSSPPPVNQCCLVKNLSHRQPTLQTTLDWGEGDVFSKFLCRVVDELKMLVINFLVFFQAFLGKQVLFFTLTYMQYEKA